MNPVTLELLNDEWDAVRARWEALRRDHDERALTTTPTEGVWPVAGIAEHLHTTLALYEPLIRAHIHKLRGAGQTGDQTVRPGWFARKFIHFAGPDNHKKLKAPKRFGPKPGKVSIHVIDRAIEQTGVLTALLAEARGVELNRGKFGSPITRLIRFTLGEGLTLMVRHHQRHTNQAEQRVAMMDAAPGVAVATQ